MLGYCETYTYEISYFKGKEVTTCLVEARNLAHACRLAFAVFGPFSLMEAKRWNTIESRHDWQTPNSFKPIVV